MKLLAVVLTLVFVFAGGVIVGGQQTAGYYAQCYALAQQEAERQQLAQEFLLPPVPHRPEPQERGL